MDDLCGEPRIRLSGPSGLLAAVPNMLGFHPTDSLVVMCLSGGGMRSARWPGWTCPAAATGRWPGQLTGHALDSCGRGRGRLLPPHAATAAVLGELLAELDTAGVGLLTALVVHAGRMWPAVHDRPLRLADSLPVPDQDDPDRAGAGRGQRADRSGGAGRPQAAPRLDRRSWRSPTCVAEQAFTAVAQGGPAYDIRPCTDRRARAIPGTGRGSTRSTDVADPGRTSCHCPNRWTG